MSPCNCAGGVHRLQRRMDVDVGGVFRLDHLGRRAERRRGVAILDEEQPGIVERLQDALASVSRESLDSLALGPFVKGDLQRVRLPCGRWHRCWPPPPPSRSWLRSCRRGWTALMKPGTFLGLAVVDRFHRGARSAPAGSRPGRIPCPATSRRCRIWRCRWSWREYRAAAQDTPIMVYWSGVFSLIALSSSGVKVLVALPLLTISANVIDFFDFGSVTVDSRNHQLIRRHAHRGGGGFGQCHAAGGTRAAHRIVVHHCAPAAAGDLRAKHGIVELRDRWMRVEPACPSSSRRVLRQ